MPAFTSRRERTLWLWAGLTLLVIYSTLGVAPRVAGLLREHGLLRAALTGVLVVAAVSVVVRLVRRRPGGWEMALALGFTFVCFWALLRAELPPEERTHLIEYAVVAGLIYAALQERRRNGRPAPAPSWLLAAVATTALGLLDEWIQSLLPNRVYDLRDIGFNTFAAVLAVGVGEAIGWARRRDRARRGSG